MTEVPVELKQAFTRYLIESAPRPTPPPPKPPAPPKTTQPTTKDVSKREVKEVGEKIKKSPKPVEITVEKKNGSKPPVDESLSYIDGVHLDVYKYFDISPSLVDKDALSKLQKINSWAFSETKNLGRALAKIQRLEIKLGKNSMGLPSLMKIYNWVRIGELNGKP